MKFDFINGGLIVEGTESDPEQDDEVVPKRRALPNPADFPNTN